MEHQDNTPAQELTRRRAEFRAEIRKLERRDWWLWSAAAVVMLLLTAAVVALSLPDFLASEDTFARLNREQLIRGLVGLVLIFNMYTVYQQYLIKRLRRQTGDQLDTLVDLETRSEQLHQLSILDPLTGLYNRRFADERLAAEVSRSSRHGRPLSVLLIDLNKFKQINDTHGHGAGDLVLQEFSKRLKHEVRQSDLPVRTGGDEFLVILVECPPERVQRLVDRLRGLAISFRNHVIPIEFAAGWAGHRPGESLEDLLHRADEALYAEKRDSRSLREPVPSAH